VTSKEEIKLKGLIGFKIIDIESKNSDFILTLSTGEKLKFSGECTGVSVGRSVCS